MSIYDGFGPANYDLQVFALPTERCEGGRERPDRRRGRKQGGERVAAVDKIKEKHKPEDFVGHRNSKTDCCKHPGFSASKASPTRGAMKKPLYESKEVFSMISVPYGHGRYIFDMISTYGG